MNKYLLDTNVVIFLFKNKYQIQQKMTFVGLQNCFISEVTLAELKIGAEKSNDPAQNHQLIEVFSRTVSILPITQAIDIFAFEKVRLEKEGTPMHDNFDVLLAATALYHGLTVVTNNVKHFRFYSSLLVEDWTMPNFPSKFTTIS